MTEPGFPHILPSPGRGQVALHAAAFDTWTIQLEQVTVLIELARQQVGEELYSDPRTQAVVDRTEAILRGARALAQQLEAELANAQASALQ